MEINEEEFKQWYDKLLQYDDNCELKPYTSLTLEEKRSLMNQKRVGDALFQKYKLFT